MSTHKVLYDFTAEKGSRMLTVKAGDLVTVNGRSSNNWCTVEKGPLTGLVPSSYLEPILAEEEDCPSKGSPYVAIYNFDSKEKHQLPIKSGDKLVLVERHTKHWWSMKNVATGSTGMVPTTYIKPDDTEEEVAENLLSIDRAIESIHNEAAQANGQYTAEQRNTLQTLIALRQTASGKGNVSPVPPEKPGVSSPPEKIDASGPPPVNNVLPTSSSPRRKPPLPPESITETVHVEPLDLAGVQLREKNTHLASARPRSEIIPNRPAPPPPPRSVSLKSNSLAATVQTKSATPPDIREEEEGENKERASESREQSVDRDEDSSQSSDGIPESISPNTKRRVASFLNRAGLAQQLETVAEAGLVAQEDKRLPTEFTSEFALEMIDVIRNRTGLSHPKSALALEGVLGFLEEKVPEIASVMDGLKAALHASQSVEESLPNKIEENEDLKRLREIFFEMREARDDSQQRGWAIRDDSEAIGQYLEELLQILYDADPVISKAAIQEDKYENILTLISYYQLEPRVPLRILLLKIFGAFCTLDQEAVSVMLQSVLPNELGNDIQVNINETYKTYMSTIVCTMMFSTSEEVPLSVYDQWSLDFVNFLLDAIENPPDSDVEDELPDAFLNVLLSFNQHFQYPSNNTVMQALKVCENPRNFSEKLMLLVNRGEDPVSITTPCCPDSLTKVLLDLFSDESTAAIFYTTDLKVLIDIISRQLHDLSPGDTIRLHYIELLSRLLGSTQYTDHNHRREEIRSCLNRILKEEGQESLPDQEAIKRLFESHPGVFNND